MAITDYKDRTLDCGCKQTMRFTNLPSEPPGEWETIEACSEHGYPWQTKRVALDEYEGYLIRARTWTGTRKSEKPMVLDVEVYEYFNVKLDGKERTMNFQKRGATSHPDYELDIEKAEKYVHGSIKWDGCSNLNFGDNGYFHFCGKQHARMLGKITDGIYELADEMIECDMRCLE